MPLNKLQEKVLLLYGEGLSHADIGRKIGLSELTVSLILNSAVDRLGVNNTVQAINHLLRSNRDLET
ncbi:MAG: response regulator transcription factor [Hyphomicrobiales bacterium]|nr:response regulator transcription factor [Hyphomicrobiales bacterium]